MTSASCLLLDGHEVVAEHQLDRHGAQQVVLNSEILQVDEFGAIAFGQRLGLRAVVLRLPEAGLPVRLRLPWLGYPPPPDPPAMPSEKMGR